MAPRRTILPLLILAALTTAAGAGADLEEASPRLRGVIEDQMRRSEERPGDAGVHNDLGNLLLLAGEAEAAREAYLEALRHDADLESARYNLALLLHQEGKRRAAARQLRRLIRRAPEHARARYALGVVHAERNHSQRAVRHYARALELDPHLADPESNAHAIKNRYLTRASLLAYSRRPEAVYVERSYEEGARIAAQMVGALGAPTIEPAVDGEQEASPQGTPDAESTGAGAGASGGEGDGAEVDPGTEEAENDREPPRRPDDGARR